MGRCTAVSVYLFEKLMPDPYVFAVLLTFAGALLAWWLAPDATPETIGSAWYEGIFTLFTFAFQMVIMLVAGYALATAPQVHRGLARLASMATTPTSAISLPLVVGMIASWLNWGLGLVVAALLAREIAKRVRIDFGWLVAAAYSGFVISTEGLSGSIALSHATHGSAPEYRRKGDRPRPSAHVNYLRHVQPRPDCRSPRRLAHRLPLSQPQTGRRNLRRSRPPPCRR